MAKLLILDVFQDSAAVHALRAYTEVHPRSYIRPFWTPLAETLQYFYISRQALQDFNRLSGFAFSEHKRKFKLK